MLKILFGWIFKPNVVKASVGLASGGAVTALMFGLHGDITKRIDGMQTRVDRQVVAKVTIKSELLTQVKKDRKEYVSLVLRPVQTEIKNLNEKVTETKNMVKDIHQYLLQTK